MEKKKNSLIFFLTGIAKLNKCREILIQFILKLATKLKETVLDSQKPLLERDIQM